MVLTQDASRTVKSSRYGETYHSSFGAVTESRYVYLERSGVLARLERGMDTRVLEIGFGLGLNFLLTADAALAHGVNLEYHAFEHDLVARETFDAMGYQAHLSQPGLSDRLAAGLFGSLPAETVASSHRHVYLGDASPTSTELYLSLTDVTTAKWPQCTSSVPFDAIYLDAFSPDTNAECWSDEMLSRLYGTLRPDGGTLATYCAKGAVRRRLERLGFAVTRHPGPPGKREVLSASRTEQDF